MANLIKAEWKNREQLMAKLRTMLPAETEKNLAKAQMDAASDLAAAIRTRAPVRTGTYRDSIRGGRLADKPKDAAATGSAFGRTKDPNATGVWAHFRWRWLEFGTVKMPAQPHALPTYRGMKKRIRRRMAKAVNDAVRATRRK